MSHLRNSAEMDEALETGEDSLLTRLRMKLPNGIDGAFSITVAFKAPGHGSEQVFKEEGHILLPDAYRMLCQKIAKAVFDRHTTAAVGYMRIRVYQAGESQNALVDYGRNIAPSGTIEEAPLSWMREVNAMQSVRIATLEQQLKEAYVQMSSFATNAHNQLVQLATVRGPVTAAGELTSLWSVMAVALLAIGGPHLRKALGLENGNVDLVKVIEFKLKETFGLLPPPKGAAPGTTPPPEPQDGEDGEPGAGSISISPQLAIEWLRTASDEEIAEVRSAIQADPALMLRLAA